MALLHAHAPVAARLQNVRDSGHGFRSLLIQGQNGIGISGTRGLGGARGVSGVCVGGGPPKGPLKSNEPDRLGYEDVVERCDSVDFANPKNFFSSPPPQPQKVDNNFLRGHPYMDDDNNQGMHAKALNLDFNGQHVADYERIGKIVPARPSSAVYRAQLAQKRLKAQQPQSPNQESPPIKGGGLGGWEAAMIHSAVRGESEVIGRSASAQVGGGRPEKGGIMGPWGAGGVGGRSGGEEGKLVYALEEEKRKNERLSYMLQMREKSAMEKEIMNKKLMAANEQLKDALQQTSRARPWSASSAYRARPPWGEIPVQLGGKTPWGASPRYENIQNVGGNERGTSALSLNRGSGGGHGNFGGGRKEPYKVGGGEGQMNIDDRPAFGAASLEHRAVYSPFPDEPSEGPFSQKDLALPEGGPIRDDLVRPAAHKFSLSLNMNNIVGNRSRPQSANAAVQSPERTSSYNGIQRENPLANGLVGVKRPISARPFTARGYSSGARNGVVIGGRVPPRDQDRQKVVDLLVFLRAKATSKYVRVLDFIRPYDKFKTGFVTFAEFRRGLEACGCFMDVQEDKYETIMELFKENKEAVRPSSARGPYAQTFQRVCYTSFCEAIQPSGCGIGTAFPMTVPLQQLISSLPECPVNPRFKF